MQQPKMTSKSRITHKTDSNGRRGTSEISLTHAAFASLLDTIFYPNPDDSGEPKNPFGPFGPAGPVTQRWMWAALNPQPLPPGPDPYSEFAWAALNPQPLPPGPDPYRAAFAARVVIDRASAQCQIAEVFGAQQAERSIIIVGGKVREIVDEWCGTPVPGRRGPLPHPVALLAAGAQFQIISDKLRENPLQSVFASAAEQLFKAGLKQAA